MSGYIWCKDCLFSVDWASGDERIDEIIKNQHDSIICPDDFVKWVLFEQLRSLQKVVLVQYTKIKKT